MNKLKWQAALRAPVLGAALALLAWPGAALADWYRADSDHFIVYANDSWRDIEDFTKDLERFHVAMARTTATEVTVPSPSNRVTIYVVRSAKEVREIHGGDSKYLNGFYLPRAGGSLAIVPRIGSGSSTRDVAMITLLHEYAHHFLISAQRQQMPRWVSEGGAEFFASVNFLKDGTVQIGRAAQHRGYELFNAEPVPVEELLDPAVYEAREHKRYDAFYGRAWLLYHYLTFSKERAGQLTAYLRALGSGTDEREAALQVFGDFDALDDELGHYLRQWRIMMMELKASSVPTGKIAITQLSEGEAEIMPLRIRSKRGVDLEQARELLGEVHEIAAAYPDDPGVLSVLAEAEHDAHNYQAAVDAADRTIALDPTRTNAYVQKGYALFALARDTEGTGAERAEAYKRAREPFIALNRIENDHPLPLVWFYRSYVESGKDPSELALRGLVRASELAPFDLDLQMQVALALIPAGYQDVAAYHLGPVAHNPHGGSGAAAARALLERLEREPKWDGKDIGAVMAQAFSDPEEDAPLPGPESAPEGEEPDGKASHD